ncbi:MAG: DMT family transporter [Chlamydiota bacterium]
MRAKGLIFFWLSVIIFAAANSILSKLGQEGANHLIHGRNPISFCNVLFTANLIAGFTLLGIYRKSWNRENLKQISFQQWFVMLSVAILANFLAPTLIFIGLMLTEVINVVLISTLDIPLALIFGWIISKERPKKIFVIAALLALTGVAVNFWLSQPAALSQEAKMTMINIGHNPIARFFTRIPRAGEMAVALGVTIIAAVQEYSRAFLSSVPAGIYSVFRMLVGTAIFFFVVIAMLGWVHFIDIFSPFLWEWMLIYGGVIIAGGLYLWYTALPIVRSADFSIGNAFAPLAGIGFAFLILGEVPDRGQMIGGMLILVSIVLALCDKLFRFSRVKKVVTFSKTRSFTGL